MNKLFDDTLFSDTITINKREYNAADVALYVIMMDELVGHTNSDFIHAMDMELRVMLSCMSEQDVKIIKYHKLKVIQEYDRQQLRSRVMKKRRLSHELNEKAEFEKSMKLIDDSFPNIDKMKPADRKDYSDTLDKSSNYEIERMPEMEVITDEPDEVLF